MPRRVPDHHPGVTPPPARGPSVRPSSFRRASSFHHFRDAAKMIPVPISRPPAFLFPRAPPPACAFHIFDPPSIFSPGPAGNEKNASHLINFCALEPAKVLVCAGRTRRRAGGGYRRGCIAINGGEEKSRAFGIFAGGRVCLAGALLVLAALAGRCLASAWLAVLAVCCLPCAWVGGRVCLARWRWCWRCLSAGGSGLRRSGMLRRRSATRQARTAPASTAGPSSGEGLPIVPPRPGSAIAGRPAENGHGPPPRVFTAPGLVSW